MKRQTRVQEAERPMLSDDEFWDRMIRLHLAQAALIRQWRGQGGTLGEHQEAPKTPRYLGP